MSRRGLAGLFGLWVVSLLISGWEPKDRLTWWLEVFPVLVAMPVLWFTYKKFPLPRFVYFCIFIHGLVLMTGGHYTYAETPVGDWLKELFHLERNNFDRIGHFLQGFVPALIAREVLIRTVRIRSSPWVFFLSVTICLSISAVYEFIEWWSAILLGQGAEAFLGTQGDPWDTQWDMFLATIGALSANLLSSRFFLHRSL